MSPVPQQRNWGNSVLRFLVQISSWKVWIYNSVTGMQSAAEVRVRIRFRIHEAAPAFRRALRSRWCQNLHHAPKSHTCSSAESLKLMQHLAGRDDCRNQSERHGFCAQGCFVRTGAETAEMRRMAEIFRTETARYRFCPRKRFICSDSNLQSRRQHTPFSPADCSCCCSCSNCSSGTGAFSNEGAFEK